MIADDNAKTTPSDDDATKRPQPSRAKRPTVGKPKSGAKSVDPRRNLFRPDLAASVLEGRVNAREFVDGKPAQVQRASVPVRLRPEPLCGLETEVLFGDIVTVYEQKNGWSWVQLNRDHYVGYIPSETLSSQIVHATHRIKSIGTFVYPSPTIKTPPMAHLSINTQIGVADMNEEFCKLETGGFVVSRHVAPLDRFAKDYVEVAERFIGTPYLWGGRTRVGIDCSGLVQVALEAAGFKPPRDTDMQQNEVGSSVLVPDDLEGLRRGDLIFWKGHVGIMVDGIMMLHANGYHMSTVIETLPEAAARMARVAGPIIAIKRLESLRA
ncbi:MAG: NlpC/P60 family protein [Hyphomicrobiaceae bacterium]